MRGLRKNIFLSVGSYNNLKKKYFFEKDYFIEVLFSKIRKTRKTTPGDTIFSAVLTVLQDVKLNARQS